MEENELEAPKRTQVGLRIFAPGINPEEITTSLGISPDHSHHEGDYPQNDSKYSSYKHGMWSINSKLPEERLLEEHIDSILSILEPYQAYIQAMAKQATVDLYCVLYAQNGFELSPGILKRIGNMGITFGVTLYNP